MKQLLLQLAKFTTSEISDALDSCRVEGALLNILPLAPGLQLIGPAFTVLYEPYKEALETFQGAADYIDAVPAQSVILIDNAARRDCTTWGEILTRFASKKGIAGTVVNGAIRDVAYVRDSQYPVYCSSTYMRSGKNRVYKASVQCAVSIHGVIIHPGDIILGDENGVLAIPQSLLADVIYKAGHIKNTEQKIIAAVEAGISLAQARKDFHYEQPWLSRDK